MFHVKQLKKEIQSIEKKNKVVYNCKEKTGQREING